MSSTRPNNLTKEKYKTEVKALVKTWSEIFDTEAMDFNAVSEIFAIANIDENAKAVVAFETSVRVIEGEFKAEKESTQKELESTLKFIAILKYQFEALRDIRVQTFSEKGKLTTRNVSNSDEKLLAAMHQMLSFASEESGQPLPAIQLPPANPRFGFSSANSSNPSPVKLNFKNYVPMPSGATAQEQEQIARHMEEKEKSIAPKIMREVKELVAVCCQRWTDVKMRMIATALLTSDSVNFMKLAPTYKEIEALMKELKRHNETSFFELRIEKADYIKHGDKIKVLISQIDECLQEIQKVKPITSMDLNNAASVKLKLEEYNKTLEKAYKNFESTMASKAKTTTNNNNTNSNILRK